jgi:hypothetical protein
MKALRIADRVPPLSSRVWAVPRRRATGLGSEFACTSPPGRGLYSASLLADRRWVAASDP